MQKHEFALFVKRLGEYYERGKDPKQGALDAWYEKIHHVPSEAMRWVESKIQDECDNFPHNLSKTVNEYHIAWQQANPDKRAPEHHFDCPECNNGLIFAKKRSDDTNVRYRYVFKCPMCRQSSVDYPSVSRVELINQGYDIC